MRLVLVALAAAVGTWLVLRRRRGDEHRVVVAWEDGSELDLVPRSPDRERLARIAEGVLG